MPAKKKAAKKASVEKKAQEDKLPPILTVSEAAKLSDEQREAFADANGTVVSDPE